MGQILHKAPKMVMFISNYSGDHSFGVFDNAEDVMEMIKDIERMQTTALDAMDEEQIKAKLERLDDTGETLYVPFENGTWCSIGKLRC